MYFELRSHFLFFYEEKPTSKKVVPRGLICLEGLVVNEKNKEDYDITKKFGFSIGHKEKIYRPIELYCESLIVRKSWFDHLVCF